MELYSNFKLKIIKTQRKFVRNVMRDELREEQKREKKKVLADLQRLLQAACKPINDLACVLGVY